VLPQDAACPLIIPKLSSPRSPLSTMFSPLVWMYIIWRTRRCRLKIVRTLVIKERPFDVP